MTDNMNKYHKKKHLSFLVFKIFGTKYRDIHKNIEISFDHNSSYVLIERKKVEVRVNGKIKYHYPFFPDILSFLFKNKCKNIYSTYSNIRELILESKCNLGPEIGYGRMNIT